MTSNPSWDWETYNYRIKEEEQQKVTIEKLLIRDINTGEYFIMESSDVDLTLKDFQSWWKVKLIGSFDVEI